MTTTPAELIERQTEIRRVLARLRANEISENYAFSRVIALTAQPTQGYVLVPRAPSDDQIRQAYAAGMKAVRGSTGRACDANDLIFMRAFLRAMISAATPADGGKDG